MFNEREANDEYESDDNEVEDDFVNHATAVILDNCEKMFQVVDEDGSSPFKNCLEALYKALEKHVFSKWTSRLRIQLLDGREHGVFYNLSRDLLDIMKKLKEEKDKPVDELKAIYCSQGIDNNVFYESILDACDSLRKNTKETDSKNVVILTNDFNCNDCNSDNDDLERVLEMMQANKIELIVLPLVSEFEWSKFYGKLVGKVMNDSSMEEDMTTEGYEDVDDLLNVLDSFVQPKKTLDIFNFFYAPNRKKVNTSKPYSILVHVRKAFKKKSLNRNVNLNPETMRECVSGNKYTSPENETDDAVPTDILDARMWTEEFEPEVGKTAEATNKKKISVDLAKDYQFTKALRSYGEGRSLRLLYLCEKRTSAHCINKPALIINPFVMDVCDDEMKKGIKLFQHFWNHCYENNKVMICRLVNRTSRQKYYLVQLEPKSKNDYIYFMAQYLSFHNGIKDGAINDEFRSASFSGEDLSTMDELVNKLTIKDNNRPFLIESSDYETKASLIKEMLLSVKQDEWQPPDKCVNWPTQEQISEKIGEELELQINKEYITQVITKKKRK